MYESIWEIVISIEYVIEYLKEKCEVNYKSSLWLWTQMKRYEEELGVKLFRKVKNNKNDTEFSIAIYYPFKNFFQKQHLYVTEKIKVANGVFDLLQNLTGRGDRKITLKLFWEPVHYVITFLQFLLNGHGRIKLNILFIQIILVYWNSSLFPG